MGQMMVTPKSSMPYVYDE